ASTSDSGTPSGRFNSNRTRNSIIVPWLLLPVLTKEREKCCIDLFSVSPHDVVRTALHRDERAVGDQRGKPRRSHLERKNAIRRAVKHEYRDVDLRQVGPEIGQPGV